MLKYIVRIEIATLTVDDSISGVRAVINKSQPTEILKEYDLELDMLKDLKGMKGLLK